MDWLTMEWAWREGTRFLLLYVALYLSLTRRTVGLDGELSSQNRSLRARIKSWLEQVVNRL